MSARCVVCNWHDAINGLCTLCGRSYDENAHDTGDIMTVIEWAAKRARYFALRKPRRKKGPTP